MTPNGSTPGNGAIRYSYDAENRLNKVETHNGSAYGKIAEAAYDGEGNRARLVAWVGSTPLTTTYTLDPSTPLRAGLNAGLVQVLAMQDASGTTYLYGVTRLGEQQPGGWAYHLGDALGSVRQLADASAQVTLALGYMPYGEALWSLGSGSGAYGYTGEDWDRIVLMGAQPTGVSAHRPSQQLTKIDTRMDWAGKYMPHYFRAKARQFAGPYVLWHPDCGYAIILAKIGRSDELSFSSQLPRM